MLRDSGGAGCSWLIRRSHWGIRRTLACLLSISRCVFSFLLLGIAVGVCVAPAGFWVQAMTVASGAFFFFLCASRMLTVSSGKRFCSWACCLYHIKVKWLQNAVCKSLVAGVPRKSAVVKSGSLLSVTWSITWIFLQYGLITCWLKIKCKAALLARWGPDVWLCYATLTSELFLLWIAFLTCWGLFLKHFLLFFFSWRLGKLWQCVWE